MSKERKRRKDSHLNSIKKNLPKVVLILPTIISLILVNYLDTNIELIESQKKALMSDYEDLWKNIDASQKSDLKSSIYLLGSQWASIVGPSINNTEALSEFIRTYFDIARDIRIDALKSLSVNLNIDDEVKETWNEMNMMQLKLEGENVQDFAQEAVYYIKNKNTEYGTNLVKLKNWRNILEYSGALAQIIVILYKQDKK